MIDIVLTLLGWAAAIALLVYAFLNWPEERYYRLKTGRVPGAAFVIGAALFMVMLVGCSTPTVTKVETIEVQVPVAVQPIRPNQVPLPPAPLGPRPAELSAAADVLLAKVCEFVAYTLWADPLLRVSAGVKPAMLPVYPECERSR